MGPLIHLVESIQTHEALNNIFFQKWIASPLSIHQVSVFARNYWEVTYKFPKVLALLIANVANTCARAEYTKTLYSEMGNGNTKAVHSILFERFCNDLFKCMGASDYLTIEKLKEDSSLLPETQNLINGQIELYTAQPSIAVGAQLALEWQAYTMIRKLYDGAKNYSTLWPTEDSFHESCEFFYVHIGSAEKEHKKQALLATERIIENDNLFLQMKHGFDKHLDLLAKFWNGIGNYGIHSSE